MLSEHSAIEKLESLLYAHLKAKRYFEAERLLRNALKDLGPTAKLYNLLGVAFSHQSRFDDAIDHYQKALSLDETFTEAAINLAITYCDLGQYDAAKAIYERQSEYKSPQQGMKQLAEEHVKTAEAYKEAGRKHLAVKELETAINLCPSMQSAHLELANLYLSLEDLELSKATLKAYVARFKADAKVHNLLGLIAYGEGDFSKSRYHWEKSQSIQPEDRASKLFLRGSKHTTIQDNL